MKQKKKLNGLRHNVLHRIGTSSNIIVWPKETTKNLLSYHIIPMRNPMFQTEIISTHCITYDVCIYQT